MRALGYFVVDPAASPVSPASRAYQEQAFLRHCRKDRHVPAGTFVDSVQDQGGAGYQDMLQHIRQTGRSYLLAVTDPRYLGNELEEGVRRLLELDALDVRVVCTDPHVADPLQGMLRVWSASSPQGMRRERIREAMRAKAVRGQGLGKPPYGYRIGQNGRLEPVPEEAQVVRLIYGLYVEQGLGVRSIARYLNERDHKTRRGQAWSMVTIRDILRNRAYIGTYTRFGLRVAGSHPGLVPPDDFRRAQDRMRERSPVRRHPRSQSFLLSGLAYCGECGGRMMGVTRRQTWRRKDGERVRGEYRYYQCQSRTNRSQCQYHTWRAADLEGQVVSQVRRHLEEAGEVDVPQQSSPTPEQPESASGQASLAALRRRYLRYVRRAAGGALSLPRLRTLLAGLEAERARLAQGVARPLPDAESLARAYREQRQRFLDEWAGISVTQRQELMRSLVRRVTVWDRRVEVALRGAAGAADAGQ